MPDFGSVVSKSPVPHVHCPQLATAAHALYLSAQPASTLAAQNQDHERGALSAAVFSSSSRRSGSLPDWSAVSLWTEPAMDENHWIPEEEVGCISINPIRSEGGPYESGGKPC